MKKIIVLLLGCIATLNGFAQDNEHAPNEGLPSTMFSVETGYHYNGFIGKSALSAKAYVWFLKRNSIGPEFHVYFPSSKRNYFDYQLDFNFRRIVVDFHPLTFDVLLGPAYRNTLDTYDENGKYVEGVEAAKRVWLLDGFNIGFGVNYRMGSHSMYFMPKINTNDAQIQFSAGYKFHFDPFLSQIFNRRYKLRKKRKKN